MCVLAAAILVSCKDGSSRSVVSQQDCSGLGYACNLQREGAELQFRVLSLQECDVELCVRCRCRFDYDSDACMMEYGGKVEVLSISPDGRWNTLTFPVVLKEGVNVITFKGVHPMKDDVSIDYIEFK